MLMFLIGSIILPIIVWLLFNIGGWILEKEIDDLFS